MERKPQTDNSIVAYINDKAVVVDEDENIFFCVMPEELAVIGETIFEEDLTPLYELNSAEQYDILIQLHGLGVL